ncbi:MAG: enoyl-CoA hydratase [Dehalococcoidia bacterium]|nr:enoyl-CoA hydratase [Dehalococcoidia bacterium]
MPAFESVLYETPAPHIARIVMNRPEARNAQNYQLTYDLNAAFDHAAQDDEVKVIILAGSDPHFSAGHDLRGNGGKTHADYPVVGTWGGFALKGAEGFMANEEEIYLQMCRRWRNIPKPVIAQVQGKCIAGGLMLAWVCDLIVASEDAQFQDPVVAWAVPGVEYFAHPWEIGPRKAKELLFTGDWFSAAEMHRLGMVNQVVPREELAGSTLALAEKIAQKPSFGLKLAKEAVNQSVDAQGQWSAMQAVFSLHQLAHSHNLQVFGVPMDPSYQSVAQRPKE